MLPKPAKILPNPKDSKTLSIYELFYIPFPSYHFTAIAVFQPLDYFNSILTVLSSFSLARSCFHSATRASVLKWQLNYVTVQGL